MRKEIIKDIDGNEKEATIGVLPFTKRNEILSKCIELTSSGKDFEIKRLDYFGLQSEVLKATVRGIPIDNIPESEGERIFNKYFKHVIESIGGGGKKNSEQTSETSSEVNTSQ